MAAMEIILLLARLSLAAVFAVAGISKLANLEASRQSVMGFGVPKRLAQSIGWLLPIAEIVTAILLLFVESAWAASLAALLLLALFIIVISVSLARGLKTDCNCFGQIHSTPISWSLVARNLAFSALALVIIAQGKVDAGIDIFKLAERPTLAEKINLFASFTIIVLLGVLAIFLKQLLNQQQTILRRLAALKDDASADGTLEIVTHQDLQMPRQAWPIGAPAPSFALRTIDAEESSLDHLLANGKSLMLVFVAPSCAPCLALLADIEQWQRRSANQLTLVILSKGSLEENQKKFDDYAIEHILLQQESEVAEAYQIPWTPGAIVIQADGTIASHVAYGSEQIRELFNHLVTATTRPWLSPALEAQEENSKPAIGDQAPAITLVDVAGKPLALADFFSQKTLLLFWNPDCGFCQAMLDKVKHLQAARASGAPNMVIISRGTAEEISRQGLQAPILLDDEFKAGKAFGATGTPSAVLIDEQGRIASSMATGESEVLALAGAGRRQSAKVS